MGVDTYDLKKDPIEATSGLCSQLLSLCGNNCEHKPAFDESRHAHRLGIGVENPGRLQQPSPMRASRYPRLGGMTKGTPHQVFLAD